MERASITDQIRSKYRTPRSAWRETERGYCVGGALCVWARGERISDAAIWHRYPGPDTLESTILAVRREHGVEPMVPDQIDALVCAIITANDSGNYPYAWDLLEVALTGDSAAVVAAANEASTVNLG